MEIFRPLRELLEKVVRDGGYDESDLPNEAMMIEWLCEAMWFIGSSKFYRSQEGFLKLQDGKTYTYCLPCNAQYIQTVTYCKTPIFPTTQKIRDIENDKDRLVPNYYSSNEYYIDEVENTLVLMFKPTSEAPFVTFVYIPTAMDEEIGVELPLVYDDGYVFEAMTKYVLYKDAQQKFRKGRLDARVYQLFKQEWGLLKLAARGSTYTPTLVERENIKNLWLRHVVDTNAYGKSNILSGIASKFKS